MDVHCSTCEEPWDVYHLWHEAIFETGLSAEEARAWGALPRIEKLSDYYRQEFRSAGWEFGQCVINVTRCPCCPRDALANPARVHTKAALEELFDGDEDGLASTFEEYRL